MWVLKKDYCTEKLKKKKIGFFLKVNNDFWKIESKFFEWQMCYKKYNV